jgi:hypothetical protein
MPPAPGSPGRFAIAGIAVPAPSIFVFSGFVSLNVAHLLLTFHAQIKGYQLKLIVHYAINTKILAWPLFGYSGISRRCSVIPASLVLFHIFKTKPAGPPDLISQAQLSCY